MGKDHKKKTNHRRSFSDFRPVLAAAAEAATEVGTWSCLHVGHFGLYCADWWSQVIWAAGRSFFCLFKYLFFLLSYVLLSFFINMICVIMIIDMFFFFFLGLVWLVGWFGLIGLG